MRIDKNNKPYKLSSDVAEVPPSTSQQQPQTPDLKNRRSKATDKDKINIRYKVVQETVHKNITKHMHCNKSEETKNFRTKTKKITDKRILTDTPHTAGVQTFGKTPRLLRNFGFAFVPYPLTYGLCRP